MVQLFKHFLEEAAAKGSKSSALQPLLWLFGIVSSAFACLARVDAPNPILWVVAILWIVVCLTILAVYVFLLFKNPDALRSERFTMYKMAMEKALIGDDIHGLIRPSDKLAQIEEKAVDIEGGTP